MVGALLHNMTAALETRLAESFWVAALSGTAVTFLNMGLVMGMTFGVLILLRPVTNRLIAPRYRVWIWFVGWYTCFLIQIYRWIGRISLLPVSFRSLVVPRTESRSDGTLPEFLPDVWKPGDYTVVLPGGAEFPIHISAILQGIVALVWVGTLIGLLIWDGRQTRRLKRIGLQGVKMTEEQRVKYGVDRENTVVRLCKNLPTSFVRFGNEEGCFDGVRFVICLQDDLPEERMELVMRHELEHLRQHHPWWKSVINTVMYFYWWNPILWIAYRLTCRDMELACDEAVMASLDERERREYARTLVDLGAGRPMWGALTSFGECDAALRVRRVVGWKPRKEWTEALSLLLAAVMVLFFYCGSWEGTEYQSHMQMTDWLNYAQGPQVLLDLREKLGRPDWTPREVWYRTEDQLVVLDEDGVWYHCVFYGERARYVSHVKSIGEPDLRGYSQLSIWTGETKTP